MCGLAVVCVGLSTVYDVYVLGVVGQHEDFPIECIRLAPETVEHKNPSDSLHILASCSHDNLIKFWDVEYLFEDDEGSCLSFTKLLI